MRLMVLGERGVGKSTLVSALSTRWIARSENFLLSGEEEVGARTSRPVNLSSSSSSSGAVEREESSIHISYWSLPEEKTNRRVRNRTG
jgi:GTPase SAR1 family protein